MKNINIDEFMGDLINFFEEDDAESTVARLHKEKIPSWDPVKRFFVLLGEMLYFK